MYVFEISIENKSDYNPQGFGWELDWLVAILFKNGQIWKEWTTIRDRNTFRACVQAHERRSLQKKYCNQYFQNYRRELEKLTGAKLIIRYQGITSEHCEPCRCKKHDHFILQTSYSQTCSPITCGSCKGSVPLYHLPYLGDEKEYYSILSWISGYKACDNLNIGCGFGERWGVKQMSDPDSGLSREGRNLCEAIESKTGIPTYYYLYNYRNITHTRDKQRVCPLCGKKWFQNDEAYWAEQFRCDPCRIISNLTFDAKSET